MRILEIFCAYDIANVYEMLRINASYNYDRTNYYMNREFQNLIMNYSTTGCNRCRMRRAVSREKRFQSGSF